jgi:hypothetical protein
MLSVRHSIGPTPPCGTWLAGQRRQHPRFIPLRRGTEDCKHPAREAEFHRWYEDIHVADILETGAFHTA